MKKTTIILGILFATSMLFSQSINANFETDMEGWTGRYTGHFKIKERIFDGSEGRERVVVETNFVTAKPSVEWSNLFAPMNDRGGIRFLAESTDRDLFLFIHREISDLLPNTNYRITFNMNWLAWLDISASPITIRVGATIHEPRIAIATSFEPDENPITKEVNLATGERRYAFSSSITREIDSVTGEIQYFAVPTGERDNLFHVYRVSEVHDLVVAGQLTPNEDGHAFMQNVNNFDNAFYVNTDDEGRLFLMIGIETENEKIENVFLNTLRVILQEIPEIQDISDEETEDIDENESENEDKNKEITIENS